MSEDYKPRFSFEISEELKQRADRVLSTYGQRKALFVPILEDVLDMIEEYGEIAIGVIMSKKLRPRDVIKPMQRAEEIKDGRPR